MTVWGKGGEKEFPDMKRVKGFLLHILPQSLLDSIIQETETEERIHRCDQQGI